MRNQRLRKYLRHGMFPQLVAFEACIRHGSVTRAAAELSLAQPTVSCLVKKLSDSMGGPLTAVRERRIVATPLGIELLGLCNDVLDAFEGFDARLAAKAPGKDAGEEKDDAMEAAEL
jgi:LysR family glycine cleavage system transcriptional activator